MKKTSVHLWDRIPSRIVLRETFKVIHRAIPKSDAMRELLLPDNANVVVDYERLITQEANEIDIFLPEGAKKKYNVLTLFPECMAWVDIRGGLADDSLDKLRWGITAKKL